MRKKLLRLAVFVVLLGMIGIVIPVDALPPEPVWFPLWDEGNGESKDDGIVIDLAHARYATQANAGEKNGKVYYELMAYNPSAIPKTITWGMVQADINGSLLFKGKFDSSTLAWIESYGLTGATFSIKKI